MNKKMLKFFIVKSILTVMVLMPSFSNASINGGGDDYKKLWSSVDSLSKKGLYNDALKVVEDIKARSLKENAENEYVKAWIYKVKFESLIKEDSEAVYIREIEKEIKTSKGTLNAVLHSLTAELYSNYYRNNEWEIQERTTISEDFKLTDFETWDASRFFDKINFHYLKSIENKIVLQSKKVDLYDNIIIKGVGTAALRPTLYDFLAHRALNYYKADNAFLVEPSYLFEIDKPEYFSLISNFINLKIESADSNSGKAQALRIFQDLERFHIADKNIAALIDVDLERLAWVRENSILENMDSLYMQSLLQLENAYNADVSSASVSYAIADEYFQKAFSKGYINDSSELKWYKKKAWDKADSVIDKYPKSYAAGCCKSLKSQISEKQMDIKFEQVNIPNKPFKCRFEYKNISKVYVRLAKVDNNEIRVLLSRENDKPIIEPLLNKAILKQWSVKLPDDGDFNLHSVELPFPALEVGYYMIITSNDSAFDYNKHAVNYAFTWVSNIDYIQRDNQQGKAEFYLLNRQTGEPLSGVVANIFVEKYDYRTRKEELVKSLTCVSDKEGFIQIPKIYEDRYLGFRVEFKTDNDFLALDNKFSQYDREEPLKEIDINIKIFTDRNIYRPSQVVYFKAIVFSEYSAENKHVLPNYKLTAKFIDVNGKEISNTELMTNDFGSVNGYFEIPSGVLTGKMHIRIEKAYCYFNVEEYKRPKFEVSFMPAKDSYKLSEKVTVVGESKAYAGFAIDGAKVKYRVVREANIPRWCWWEEPLYNSESREIVQGETMTDKEGNFSVVFDALPDLSIPKSANPTFSYTITADVTDINGETHSNTISINASYQALSISVDIPNKVDRESFNSALIKTENLSGQYQSAKGTIEIYELKQPSAIYRDRKWEKPDRYVISKEEFQKLFPCETYADEDKINNWEKGERLLFVVFDTKEDSLLRLDEIRNWQPGVYRIESKTFDKYGEKVESVQYFSLFSANSNSIPENKSLWITPTNSTVEPGEIATLLIGSKSKSVKVLYELENKGVIVVQKWITLMNEQTKLDIPVVEDYRGNCFAHFTCISNNELFTNTVEINVPYSNKKLDLEWMTFRNKLLPGQSEVWTLKIKGNKGDKRASELLASMYDASLDDFVSNTWSLNLYYKRSATLNWLNDNRSEIINGELFSLNWNRFVPKPPKSYSQLNWYGFHIDNSEYVEDMDMSYNGGREVRSSIKFVPPVITADREVRELSSQDELNIESDKPTAKKEPKPRTNFNETAFFFPSLKTDSTRTVQLSFTMPESLTKWKLMTLAHTKDMRIGQREDFVVTQKDLMVMPNMPRFLREGDKVVLSAKISNLSDGAVAGNAQLMLFDVRTMLPVDDVFANAQPSQSFASNKDESTQVSWSVAIPDGGYDAVVCRIVAKSGNFSDGEELQLPILPNLMLVTESLPLSINGNKTKTFNFAKFNSAQASSTLRNHSFTFEFTSNPTWYAIQALPYMMEYPWECAEQTFNRYYANSISTHIANSDTVIKSVFESWKNVDSSALLSNLEKNQELKSLLLQETPWLMEGKNESERKRRLGLLFDMKRMTNELDATLRKLTDMQTSNGGWPWFSGMRDDRYITQYIVTGLGHLDKLGSVDIQKDRQVKNMIESAVRYMDERIVEDYQLIKKNVKEKDLYLNHIGSFEIQYLYARSYFLKDIVPNKACKEALDYYKSQAARYWLESNRYLQGMTALALNRLNEQSKAKEILASLKNNAIHNEEMGMYWKNTDYMGCWHQAPIETQALLIEAFDEVLKDTASVDEMKTWLLKQKQTQDWKTTKATAEACYALLMRGVNTLSTAKAAEIKLGNTVLSTTKAEAGTGYFKTTFNAEEIKPDMGNISIVNNNSGVAWGAAYWQYYEQLDKITSAETSLSLKKKLFIERNTDKGLVLEPITDSMPIKIGDKIIVRVELRTDRDLEYVHLKDMRASGFEPINVLSGYKYQGGLGYYESTKDASTNFFMSYVRKGTYVFEYPLRASIAGAFANGISTIQCMYAPEFTAHSEGMLIEIEK